MIVLFIVNSSLFLTGTCIQGSPQKMQSSPFPILFQNSLSNIKNDFMVEENSIIEKICSSIDQIVSSMSKLWGKVWHLYHFIPTQSKTYSEDWFWVSHRQQPEPHAKNISFTCLVSMQACSGNLHCVGVKWWRGHSSSHFQCFKLF